MVLNNIENIKENGQLSLARKILAVIAFTLSVLLFGTTLIHIYFTYQVFSNLQWIFSITKILAAIFLSWIAINFTNKKSWINRFVPASGNSQPISMGSLKPSLKSTSKDELKGIKGWLALYLFYWGIIAFGFVLSLLRGKVAFSTSIFVAVFNFYACYLLLRNNVKGVGYTRTLLLLLIAFESVDFIFLINYLYHEGFTLDSQKIFTKMLFGLFINIISYLYFLKSRRVRNTFLGG